MDKLALWEKKTKYILYTIYQNKFYIKYLKKYCTRLNYWKKKKKDGYLPYLKMGKNSFLKMKEMKNYHSENTECICMEFYIYFLKTWTKLKCECKKFVRWYCSCFRTRVHGFSLSEYHRI